MCVCVVAIACHYGSSKTREAGAEEKPVSGRELQLNFTPMESPTSQIVVIGEEGEARAVFYDRYQMTVAAVRRGVLSRADTQRLLDGAGGRGFRAFFRQRDYGGGGVEEGDLFRLALRPSGESAGGLVHKAPDAVRSLVRELLSLSGRLDASPLADAYLRSSPVAAERFDAIRKDGRIQFHEADELPDGVRAVVREAMSRPDDLHPLGRAQYDQLLKFVSHGRDLFVQQKGSGHQLSLFLSAQESLPTKGAPK
jgi:hypothetical protein